MAGFGTLGVADGFSRAAPSSQVVDYMPNANRWRDDWQARYDAEAAKEGKQVFTGKMRSLTPNQEWLDRATTPIGSQSPETGFWYNDGQLISNSEPVYDQSFIPKNIGIDPSGYLIANPGRNGQSAMDTIANSQIQQEWEKVYKPYVPDFSALNGERGRMMPLMERQQTAQTAYDSMGGWNQLNAMPGPNYADPDFGQVSDDFGQSAMGAGEFPGVNMDWAADPSAALGQGAGLGVYAPPTRRQPRQWGI